MFSTWLSTSYSYNDSNNSFLQSQNNIAIVGIPPKYPSISHYGMKIGIIHHSQWILDKNGLTALIAKLAELNLGIMVSIWVLQESVSPNDSPRNFVLQILPIFLLPCVILKSIKELFLVTNCMKCVLSRFNDNKLVLNHHLCLEWFY